MDQHRTSRATGFPVFSPPMSARGASVWLAKCQDQYIHLVRVAWDLRILGAWVSVDLTPAKEPCLLVHRAVEPLRVTASQSNGRWLLDRGRGRWVNALADEAVDLIFWAAA